MRRKSFSKRKTSLTRCKSNSLKRFFISAANAPETAKALVNERIAAETAQTEKLFGFDFKIDDKSVTTNAIDEILRESNDLTARRKAWESSKEVGKTLKDGLANLQRLRNATVKPLGYKSFYSYQVSDYGMTAEEMNALMNQFNQRTSPALS